MENDRRWVVEGLVAGLIGYVTVAALFAGLNVLSGDGVFRTAALLGSALFFGLGEGGDPVAGPAPIVAYNGLHILVSLLIGLGAAWLVYRTERNRPLWYVVLFVLLAGFIYSVVVMGMFAAEIAHLLSWPVIVAANVAAGITAGGYLWGRHTQLWRELGREG